MTHSGKVDLTVHYHSIEPDHITVSFSLSSAPANQELRVSRREAVALVVDAITENKPDRVFFDVMGKVHSMAKNTVDLIKDGKLTAADLTAV